MVPLFSSPTEWWILPLCYTDRYAQCQTVHFWTGIDMPVVVRRRQPCRGAEAVSLGPVQQTTEIPQLQSIDQVFDVPFAHVQQFPRVQAVRNWLRSHSCTRRIRAWTRSFTRPLCATTDARMVQSAENCEGFRSCSAPIRWSMSLLCRSSCCRRCRSAVMDVAVIMQRQFSCEQWKCFKFSSSPELVDIFVRNRDGTFSERQFSEPSIANSCWPSRAPAQ